MSNHPTCPLCKRVSSDSIWPADGFGRLVLDRDIDNARGNEDPAEFAQRGEKYFACPCGETIWIAELGWFVAVAAAVPKCALAKIGECPARNRLGIGKS